MSFSDSPAKSLNPLWHDSGNAVGRMYVFSYSVLVTQMPFTLSCGFKAHSQWSAHLTRLLDWWGGVVHV